MFIAAVDAAPPVVKALFRLRGRIGALFGWDRQRSAWTGESYAQRLTAANLAVMISPQDPVPDLKAWLAGALERTDMRAAAGASAVRTHKRSSVSERIAALLVQ